MKKPYHILVLLIIIFGCSNQIHLTGTYKSDNPNRIELNWKYYIQGYRYIVGTELMLKEDSLFNLITCSTIADGKWFCSKDSLYLVYNTHIWRSDSLQEYGYEGKWPEMPQKPIAIEIKSNKLQWYTEYTHEGKLHKYINILQKENMP